MRRPPGLCAAGTWRTRYIQAPGWSKLDNLVQPSLSRTVEQVRYAPPGEYALDLEVVAFDELRRRTTPAHLHALQRTDFHLLLAVTRGCCTHWIDFRPHRAEAGNWLVIQPGQVHRFDGSADWSGWLLLFRPEFLAPPGRGGTAEELAVGVCLEALPALLAPAADERRSCLQALRQMARDARLRQSRAVRHSLLRHQLQALLLRLDLVARDSRLAPLASGAELQRFNRFREAVTGNFQRHHRIGEYARLLGISERSLSRASQAVAGVTAKAWLSARIALEARRLLAHTDETVAAIAERLGFDEPSNFVKFFKRETGQVPGAFRREQRGG
nr:MULTISPECIES: AraC family transcriptional regulator [Pseudomonas aeruginosa group]